MEKTHAANEEKIKRLDAALNDSENAKVRLNLEIGALNSELQELKRVSEQEKCDKEAQLKHALLKTEAFEQLCAQLEQERNELLEQKSNINDKHSKAMLAQKIAKDECETLADELKVLQEAYYNLQADKLQLEAANANSQSELKQSEALRADLLNEKEALHNEMQQQKQDFNADVKLLQEKLCQLNEEKLQLEAQHCDVVQRLVKAEASVAEKQQLEKQLNAEMLKLAAKDQVITELNNEISQLKDEKSLINAEMTSLQQLKEQNNAELRTLNNKVEDLLAAKQQQSETIAALEALRARLTASEELLEKEQKFAAQMRLDNQILQAKYREAKERAIEQAQASEERIKENRLELEGKLEKMKSKMKSLYNDETSKLKTKHEREVANMKSEMDVLRLQNKKYEDHTSKLSKQIVRLNEQNLQYQKENAIFLTNIKHYEDTRAATLPFKRPTSNVPTNSATTAALPSTSTRSLGTNLAMEDEEGELFNNTYLTDMKSGRMSEYMNKNVCAEELQYRNSLLPNHLRSSYVAQYGHNLAEDELKDGAHSLDDSMSALLNSTAGGLRKKISGTTHYKRPGPPTPGKHGGRLSFGSTEPSRYILKESCDDNVAASNVTSTSAKTPARFSFFTSRMSMGNPNKDEEAKTNVKQLSMDKRTAANLRRSVQKKNFQMIRLAGACAVCTSTPRKSKGHYDQRRLLDEILKSSPSPSPLQLPNAAALAADVKLEKSDWIDCKENFETPNMLPAAAGATTKRLSSCRAMKGRRSCLLKANLIGELTPQRKRNIAGSSSTTTTTAATGSTPQQQGKIVARRKSRRFRISRPSMGVQRVIGSSKYSNTSHWRATNRKRAQEQRLDNFNRGRMLDTLLLSAEARDSSVRNDATYTLEAQRAYAQKHNNNNNNLTNCNNDVNMQKIRTIKKEASDEDDDENEKEYMDELDTATIETNSFGFENYKSNSADAATEASAETEASASMSRALVKLQQISVQLEEAVISGGNASTDSFTSKSSASQHFDRLLSEMNSQAPFVVNQLQFDACTTSSNSSMAPTLSSNSDSMPSCSNMALTTFGSDAMRSLVAANPTQHLSQASSTHLSRTIYSGSIIVNRRIPNINTTFAVRSSSIYIKKKKRIDSTINGGGDTFADNDVILVTDQTITLFDLARMWHQMNHSARFVVGFSLFASISTLIALVAILSFGH